MAYGSELAGSSPLSDEAIKARVTETKKILAALENGSSHIGLPFEGRSKATMADLRRQIIMYESILERRAYSRTARRRYFLRKGLSEVPARARVAERKPRLLPEGQ
jgi:hypothetical protein